MQGGKRQGKRIERLEDGSVHEGRYVEGKRHGKWVLRSVNGDV